MKMGTVVRTVPRSSAEQLSELASAGTATVHEAMGRIGLMQHYMRPVQTGTRIAGNAITVLVHPGDNWMIHVAVELCRPGDVLVVAVSAENSDGMFGDLLATSLKAHGVVALVIDAGVRDVQDLREMSSSPMTMVSSSCLTKQLTRPSRLFDNGLSRRQASENASQKANSVSTSRTCARPSRSSV